MQSNAAAILPTASVTAQFLFPTLTRRIAASAAVHAAAIASALRPVTGAAADAPTTSVSALTAAKPSMCAPRWSLTTSPAASVCEEDGSEARGEKCATVLLTETQVGNAIPAGEFPERECDVRFECDCMMAEVRFVRSRIASLEKRQSAVS